MKFHQSKVSGAWIIEITPIHDHRGLFAVSWLKDSFREHGLDPAVVQSNVAFNHKRATLRGMHFQRAPQSQAKTVRATRGSVLDVIVDLRLESPTYRQWDAIELTADNRRTLYVPEGLAHGYITLADDTEVCYHVSSPWVPALESGVRWNDPAFGIEWPMQPAVISAKDEAWPLWQG